VESEISFIKIVIKEILRVYMIIAATGDIHSPVNYDLLLRGIDNLTTEPDLFLIAGDIVDRKSTKDQGPFKELRKVSNAFFGRINCPIFSCFGNNEFEQDWEEIKKQNQEIKFLNDESVILNIKGIKVGIVGTKGCLDRPTWWQRRNIPEIFSIYKKRIETIDNLFSNMEVDYKILLTHYPPTYQILTGENPEAQSEMACNSMENLIIERGVNLVITGHAHRGKKEAWINGIPVFNVGLYLNGGIVILDTEKLKPGLGRFLI